MRVKALLIKVSLPQLIGQENVSLRPGRLKRISCIMIEVLRTNDPVKLSYALSLLQDAGCEPFEADRFTASVEGSIGAIPRRILVPEEYAERAKRIVQELDEA